MVEEAGAVAAEVSAIASYRAAAAALLVDMDGMEAVGVTVAPWRHAVREALRQVDIYAEAAGKLRAAAANPAAAWQEHAAALGVDAPATAPATPTPTVPAAAADAAVTL